MKKPLEKPKKPLEEPKKSLENPKAVENPKKPLDLAVNSRYPPPYPRWLGGLPQVGGWSEGPNPEIVIGVGKSVNLPPLGRTLKNPQGLFFLRLDSD